MSTIIPGYFLVSQSYITATGRAKRCWLCNWPLCYTMYDVTTLSGEALLQCFYLFANYLRNSNAMNGNKPSYV